MVTKVVNKHIYAHCLASSYLSFEAKQYGERIMKIGWKLRKLCPIKTPYNIFNLFGESRPREWKQRFRKRSRVACFLVWFLEQITPWFAVLTHAH